MKNGSVNKELPLASNKGEERVIDSTYKKNITGITGHDFYESVIFMALVERNMNKSILLVDYSEERKLVNCLPKPKGEDVEDDILSYKGIDYTSKSNLEEQLNYDHVIIYTGFKECKIQCNHWIIVSNQEPFMQQKILTYASKYKRNASHTTLILQDIVNNQDNEYFYTKMSAFEKIDRYFEVEMDYRNMSNRIKCQKGNLTFRKTPSQIMRLIKEIYINTYPDCNIKELSKSIKMVKGGKVIDNTVLEYTPRTGQGNM